jgi:hypothetical protein
MMTFDQYSRRATMDVRDACAAALKRHIEGLRFAGAQGTDRFSAVDDDWPTYNERYTPPQACVEPGPWKYGASSMVPQLLEDTWEPFGQIGFGLWKVAELEADFTLACRTNLPAERKVLVKAIEDAFEGKGQEIGERYGLILPLPEYYGLKVRFAVTGGQIIDNEDKAARSQKDAMFTISAQASKVQVRPVFPMALKITKQVGLPADVQLLPTTVS